MYGQAELCDYLTCKFINDMIHFYSSDAKDNSIIAYGDTHQKKRLFKITYKRTRYRSFKKKCGKYELLDISQTLEEAKIRCTISISA